MIAHKNNLANKELIEFYLDYYKNLRETNVSIKKFEEEAKKKINKNGKKKTYFILPNEDFFHELFLEILNHLLLHNAISNY